MQKLESMLNKLEQRLSLPFFSLLIGFVALLLAAALCRPGFTPMYHGEVFSRMSLNPFDFTQEFALQNRILAPLLGYLTFLRGPNFVWIPLLFLVLLLALIYFMLRKSNLSTSASFLILVIFSCSNLVFIPLISPGYTDPITYFLLLLAFYCASASAPLSALFCALALLNHEQVLFLFPALVCLFIAADKRFSTKLLWLLGALIPFLLYRFWISTELEPEYSLEFYFSEQNLAQCKAVWNKIPLGIFYAFKLLWIFPLLASYYLFREGRYFVVAAYLFALLLPLLQYLIAYDLTRMYLISFPVFLMALIEMHQRWGEKKFLRICLLVLLINLVLPRAFMAQEGLFYFSSILA